MNLHRQRPAPAFGHSGPTYALCLAQAASVKLHCLASTQGASWEPGPAHKAPCSAQELQGIMILLCPGNQKLHHTGAKLSLLGGLQSSPTGTGSACENFQTATVSWKVSFVHKSQEVPLPLWLPLTLSHTLVAPSLTHSFRNSFPSPCCVRYLRSSARHGDLTEADLSTGDRDNYLSDKHTGI